LRNAGGFPLTQVGLETSRKSISVEKRIHGNCHDRIL
jgi:hypothetical protein